MNDNLGFSLPCWAILHHCIIGAKKNVINVFMTNTQHLSHNTLLHHIAKKNLKIPPGMSDPLVSSQCLSLLLC